MSGPIFDYTSRDITTHLLLEAWGSMWEVYRGAEEDSKLEQYLRSGPNTGEQVLATLSAISDTFANARVLEQRYGLRIKQKPAVWCLSLCAALSSSDKCYRISRFWKSLRFAGAKILCKTFGSVKST